MKDKSKSYPLTIHDAPNDLCEGRWPMSQDDRPPIIAHSLSEYRRLSEMGANVEPPENKKLELKINILTLEQRIENIEQWIKKHDEKKNHISRNDFP